MTRPELPFCVLDNSGHFRHSALPAARASRSEAPLRVAPTEQAAAARISWVGTQPPLSVVRVLDCERDAA
jgi:hypothetical protein